MNKEVDRSRPCVVCGKIFTPKYHDGHRKNKYKTCSPECTKIYLSQLKIKYTQEDEQKVLELKKELLTNNEIANQLNFPLSMIKRTISKHKAFITKEQAQKNAYRKKLEKNPNYMIDMRETRCQYSEEEYINKINNMIIQLELKDNKYNIPYLCEKEQLNPNSVRNSLHLLGRQDLIKSHKSSQEYEIIDFIKEMRPDLTIKHSDRTIIQPKEVDIFLPQLKLGIEYCGLFWHSDHELINYDKNYHKKKQDLAKKKGIRLIFIFEDEWLNRKQQVKNFLKSVLNANTTKIFARKCQIRPISKKDTRKFLENNHIQGPGKIKISFGLLYNNEIVGIITGSNHHRINNGNILILNRLAFLTNTQVVGGSSKLLKALINWAKQNNYNKIVSWSDNRWTEGNVYKKIGFSLSNTLPPDYSYIKNQKRYSKQSLRKKDSEKLLQKTEYEIRKEEGYFRIWDCGKKRWVYNIL